MLAESVQSSLPSEWRFTAEGGANVVLSYAGPPSPLTGSAIRLRKRKRTPDATATVEHSEVDVRFGREVIAPLLGAPQVVRMDKVPVERTFLEGLRDVMEVRGDRTEKRRAVDEVDVDAGCVVLTEDLVHGDAVLAVEIKPKWGFLPSPIHLPPASRDVKTRHCRFCMHSSLKASKAGLSSDAAARYCPLDLYSGDATRMGVAVDALWAGWVATDGKANNLRLFLNGEQLLPNNADLERLAAALRIPSSLAAPLSPNNATHLRDCFKAHLVPALSSSPLLQKLQSAQASLDPLDIEGLTTLLASRPPSESLSSLSSTPQPTLTDWLDWSAEWSASSSKPPADLPSRTLVLAYLLSATFKDCSIFIRFDTRSSPLLQVTAVKAIDLDPKPIARLVKYFDLDREIVEAFAERLSEVSLAGGVVPICVE
ncbi:hypothetical protein RQP46_000258 [Phenoliferia psychrophenolica]